ncbi:MAG: nucleoside triphosphate pyrophosphohydrolase [Alphaproteobacteria bacterium]
MEKLVRDKIPKIIIARGEFADDKTYREMLLLKVREEADEVVEAKTREDLLFELADIREVLWAVMTCFGISEEEVSIIQKNKKESRGAFDKKYILKMEDKS